MSETVQKSQTQDSGGDDEAKEAGMIGSILSTEIIKVITHSYHVTEKTQL